MTSLPFPVRWGNRSAIAPTYALVFVSATVLGCRTPTPSSSDGAVAASPSITWQYQPVDEVEAQMIRRYVDAGVPMIEEFFGSPFPEPFTLRISPDRAAFTRFFKDKWGIEETQCWWVATGVAHDLTILSPRVWSEEACEHDPEDADHVRGIVTHELVHVYHGQHNPGFEELEEIGWFIEGLATYVSGQLDQDRLADPREAIVEGAAPSSLEDAWSGRYRYGVSGTLVQSIDETYGRETLTELLPMRTEEELLSALALTEEELLSNWRAFVLSRAP